MAATTDRGRVLERYTRHVNTGLASLARLTAACAEGGPLAGKLENLWLELDVTGEAPLLPSLFFMPVAPLRPGRQRRAVRLARSPRWSRSDCSTGSTTPWPWPRLIISVTALDPCRFVRRTGSRRSTTCTAVSPRSFSRRPARRCAMIRAFYRCASGQG